MSRGLGGIEFMQGVVPESTWILVALVTQLGDTWFLGTLLVGLYVAVDRDRFVIPVSYGIGGTGLVLGLKHLIGLDRPDQPLTTLQQVPDALHPVYEFTATATGFGFPSGHALMATIVYLAIAPRLNQSTHRRRYTAAITVIFVVSLSRVVLGVHYVVDVVAGILIGLVFLVALHRAITIWETDPPTVAFGIAFIIGGATWTVVGPTPDTTLVFGTAIGAFAGWQLVRLYFNRLPRDTLTALRTERIRWLTIVLSFGILLLLPTPAQFGALGALIIILAPWVIDPSPDPTAT